MKWMRLEPGSYQTSNGKYRVFKVKVGRHRSWYLISFKGTGLGWSEDISETFDSKRDAQQAASKLVE